MGRQWVLWLVVLRLSTCEAAQPSTAGILSSDETIHQDTLPSQGVRLVTLPGTLLLTTDDKQQKQLLPVVNKDCNKIWSAGRYLKGSTTESIETLDILLKGVIDTKKKSLETLELENTKDSSTVLPDGASLRQKLEGVARQEVRESDLVLEVAPADGPQEPLLQVVPLNTTQDGLRTVWESSMCGGYLLLLLDNPEPLLTCTSNYHHSWHYHGSCSGSRRRRRSPSISAAGAGTFCNNCSLALSLARKAAPDLTLVDLVSYLISLTSGRQLYLVYDDVMPGVEVVVRSFQEVLGDATLLPYDPNILLLTEVLTSNYHVQAMRTVFILCSATHLYNLFQQVRRKVLESPTIRWIVIVDEDLTEELPLLLREGTQVALVQRVTPQKAQLLSSRVDPDGQVRFHQVGWWSVSGTWSSSSHQVKGRLLPDLQKLYSDFQGRQLVVTTNNNWPFIKIETLENGTVIPVSGIDFSLIKTLSKKLNFTYKFVRPPDGKWGGPQPDGTVTGLVGQVARHEAHVSLCELFITSTRETVVDFTGPYFLGSTTMVSPAPKQKNRSFAIFSTFTLGVWLCICLVTVLVGPLLYLVTRLLVLYLGEEDTAQYSLQSFSFNMYRSLMVQGNLITSHRWSLRFILLSWYLFSLYIYAMYSGTLTAVLAIVSYEKPIDSLFDLAQAHQDGYTISTTRDSNFENAFKSAKSGIYQKVWQLFNHEDREESFLPNPVVGFEMVQKERYVFINGRLSSELQAARLGWHKFHIGRHTFLPEGCAIACSSGSPYKDVFSSILIRLTESGLVDKWTNDEVNKVSQFMASSSDAGPTAISLQHLQAAFFIMVLGFAISAVLFVMEILASRWE